MKLREKTLLIIVIILIIIISLISVFVSFVSMTSYNALEQRYVLQDVDQAVNRLSDEYVSLTSIVSDWAPWDDTYSFVNGQDPSYISTNLLPVMYNNLRVNLIVMTNNQGKIVYAGLYDLNNQSFLVIPGDLSKELTPSNPLLSMNDPMATTTGILMLDGKPFVVASRPIIYSNFSGTPTGVVIMGRYLGPEEVTYLAKLTKPNLYFVPVGDPSLPPEFLSAVSFGQSQNVEVAVPQNRSEITGYALIRDVTGKGVLVLEIMESRDIYQQGITTTIQYIFIVLGVGLLFGVEILFILDKLVIAQLSELDTGVTAIGNSGDLSLRIPETGEEEVVSLKRSLNQMLSKIEMQHNDLVRVRQELAVRNRDLEELNRKANLYLDIYLDTITYEILNGTMALRGYAEMLHDDFCVNQHHIADKISEIAKKSARVVRNIETISRIYKNPPQIHEVNLEYLIKKEIDLYPGIYIDLEYPENCSRIVRANDMLGVVFDNLFSNSFKFGGEDTKITVSIKKTSQDQLEISVTDTGPGIFDAMKPLVFDRFVQNGTMRGSYGLGLHIVKMLVESYGGKVWADDRIPGKPELGAAIRFTLHCAFSDR
ncbi:MAG: CHASE4 domain-containing protein [Methanoregula sp.]